MEHIQVYPNVSVYFNYKCKLQIQITIPNLYTLDYNTT